MSIDATVFAFPLKTNSLFGNVVHDRLSRVAGRYGRPWPQAHGRILSSLADKQQTASFTEPEAALIEGLIGIQGRGRSASAQQLKVLFWASFYFYE